MTVPPADGAPSGVAAERARSALTTAFRAAMARLPAGVAVVAVAPGRSRRASAQARPAVPVTSLVSVSLDPPMVLFCVHVDARLREALEDSGAWAVSILDATAGGVVDWLATPGRPAAGALARVPHRVGEASGAVLLDQAQAWVECRTAWIRRAGDHDVVVGEVLAAEVTGAAGGALVHWLGRVDPLRP